MYKNHNIKIYVSTFGEKIINLKNGNPVEVGAARRDKFYYGQKDNTGNNISEENEFYGELTGLYWIWKNIKFDKDDLIGFCHYNKALKITNIRYYDSLIRRKEQNGLLLRNHIYKVILIKMK